MGREAFLARYGFGVTRRFLLATDGRHYDSKAIAGAAHGFQFPERGPLPALSFSGGEATVRRKLEGLGFTVEDVSPAEEAVSPGYWVFVCNPKKWAIDRFLAERIERDTWGIRPADRQRFASGQLALIRVGVDRRTNAERQGRPLEPGIYALCEAESTAFPGSGGYGQSWCLVSSGGLVLGLLNGFAVAEVYRSTVLRHRASLTRPSASGRSDRLGRARVSCSRAAR